MVNPKHFLHALLCLLVLLSACEQPTESNENTPPPEDTLSRVPVRLYQSVPWDDAGFRRLSEPLPAGISPFPDSGAGENSIGLPASIRLRSNPDGGLLLVSGQQVAVLPPDAREFSHTFDLSQVTARVKDVCFDGKLFQLLVQEDKAWIVMTYTTEGEGVDKTLLPVRDGLMSYQALLVNDEGLYAVGNASPAATFLESPTLLKIDPGSAEPVAEWQGQTIQTMFLDGENVHYAQQEDGQYYWVRYPLAEQKAYFNPVTDEKATPFLRMPVGPLDNGRMAGSNGTTLGLVDGNDNSLIDTFMLQSLVIDGDDIVISLLDGETLRVLSGKGGQFDDVLNVSLAQQIAATGIRNWKLIDVDKGGNFIVEGFSPQNPKLTRLKISSKGEIGEPQTSLRKMAPNRTGTPQFYCTLGNLVLIPVSNEQGVQIFALQN